MKKILVMVLAMTVLVPTATFAAEFHSGSNYTLAGGVSVEENLYIAGGNVTVGGNGEHDVMVAGGNVFVTGAVGKDLTAAAGTLHLTGSVGEDARVAGGNVIIGNTIEGELIIVGGQATILPGSQIGGDASVNAGTVTMEGTIEKDLEIRGGSVYINGTVNGSLMVMAESIELGANAIIEGDFSYESSKEAVIAEGAMIGGETIYTPYDVARGVYQGKEVAKGIGAVIGMWWVLQLLMCLATALVLWLLFRRRIEEMVSTALSGFGKELLRGFIVAVAVPVAVIILMVTVIGVPLGVIMGLLYGAGIMVARAIAAIITGSLIMKWINKTKKWEVSWASIVVGVIVFKLVALTPVLGWIAVMLVWFAALGSLFSVLYRRMTSA